MLKKIQGVKDHIAFLQSAILRETNNLYERVDKIEEDIRDESALPPWPGDLPYGAHEMRYFNQPVRIIGGWLNPKPRTP